MKISILFFIISMLNVCGSYAAAFDNVVGKVTCGQKPVADVLISDGVEVVKTDADIYCKFYF